MVHLSGVRRGGLGQRKCKRVGEQKDQKDPPFNQLMFRNAKEHQFKITDIYILNFAAHGCSPPKKTFLDPPYKMQSTQTLYCFSRLENFS